MVGAAGPGMARAAFRNVSCALPRPSRSRRRGGGPSHRPERIIDVDLHARRRALERLHRSRARGETSPVVVVLLALAFTAFAALVLLTTL